MFPHQEPLLLYACGFDALRFRRTERAAQANETAMVSMIERDLVASAMASAIITRMRSDDKVRALGHSVATCLGHPLTSSAALVKVAPGAISGGEAEKVGGRVEGLDRDLRGPRYWGEGGHTHHVCTQAGRALTLYMFLDPLQARPDLAYYQQCGSRGPGIESLACCSKLYQGLCYRLYYL